MYYVYVLQSLDCNKLYTGFSADLKSRIRKHFSHGVYTTKRIGKLKLIFYEAYTNKTDATRREKYLKSARGKRTLKLMLKETLKNI